LQFGLPQRLLKWVGCDRQVLLKLEGELKMGLFATERVLVPFDFSDEASKALIDTLEFVEDASRLYVLHVLHRLETTEPSNIWQTLDDDTRRQNVEKSFYERFDPSMVEGVRFDVTVGNPSSEILDYAKGNNITLIVIPSHGRTGLGRFFIGSVAERVIRYAHCPVLVIRQ
jgi:nucleotide-binding universal stress UspA family protein